MYFSVIIPLYNKSQHIKRCLDSILSQSFSDFEIVVVDDLSTDNGVEIIESYSDSRIILLKNTENKGPSYSRNNGIKYSSAQFLIFLDADDYITDSNYFKNLKDVTLEYQDLKIFAVSYSKSEPLEKHPSVAWERLPRLAYHTASNAGKLILTASTVCCHRSVFEDVGAFNESMRYGEDPELWFRISMRYEILFSSYTPIVYDVSVSSSLSKVNYGNTAVGVIELLKQQLDPRFPVIYKSFRKQVLKSITLAKLKSKDPNVPLSYSIYLKPFDRTLAYGISLIPTILFIFLHKLWLLVRTDS